MIDGSLNAVNLLSLPTITYKHRIGRGHSINGCILCMVVHTLPCSLHESWRKQHQVQLYSCTRYLSPRLLLYTHVNHSEAFFSLLSSRNSFISLPFVRCIMQVISRVTVLSRLAKKRMEFLRESTFKTNCKQFTTSRRLSHPKIWTTGRNSALSPHASSFYAAV